MQQTPKRQLDAAERSEWLRLTRTENVGPITFRQLLKAYGGISRAIDALPDLARRGGKKRLEAPPKRAVEEEIEKLAKLGGRFIAMCEPDYPEALAAVEDAPPVLAVLGHVSLLARKTIGIVGARNASLNGRKMAEKLARDLGAQGFSIASGMARGIDAAAHSASVETGTVAVLAGGADVVYPEENRRLYAQIVESGAVVSDQPMGSEPRAQMFPRRNRIISGLSLGVIVVEAAKQSGSLITARMALEQGREVFAVPGSPLDPRAGGSNDLLRQGAVLVEEAEDVLRHIAQAASSRIGQSQRQSNLFFETAPPFGDAPEAEPSEAELNAARELIIEHLGYSPTAIDEIIRRTGIPPQVVMTVLLELELAGRVERQSGGMAVLVG